MKRRPLIAILCLSLALILGAFALWVGRRSPKVPYADEMEAAARLHEQASALIRAEKARRGVALAEEDTLGIGLLGYDFTPIMTTAAGLEEKRTSQLPDFAALCVKYFSEAGLKQGDPVGANFSGSYPGLNLAALCAAEVMGLDLRYSASVGSSKYGANNPEYTFPEMVKTLYEGGLISRLPVLVTLGGGGDMGRNMMAYVLEEDEDIAAVEAMKQRLIEGGLAPAYIESFAQDIELHEQLYGDIKAFVNAGGNGLGLGRDDNTAVLALGSGLLKNQPLEITNNSGLTERYLSKGIPTIHLLNVRALCEESGIPFDPETLPKIGTASLYFGTGYPRSAVLLWALAALSGVLAAALLAPGRKRERQETVSGRMKQKLTLHALVAALLMVAVLVIYLAGRRVRLPYADEMEAAATLQRQVVAAVRAERLKRGYALAPEDRLGLGLMGTHISPVTTSLGSEEAKRTSQLSDFAALTVRYLHEAGVRPGDRIGACFSASFPGIDLGVLCAAEIMDLHIVYSVSIGSSNFGANLPGYVLPEMILTAYEGGLISTLPDLVTMGGDGDAGENMLGYMLADEDDIRQIEAMKVRLEQEGLPLTFYEEGYEADVLDRMARMGDVAAFVNVGGNILGMGDTDAAVSFGQGLLPEADPKIVPKSGLVERYLSRGVPTVHFLNIKQLCAETGIPYDPVAEPEVGTSGAYYSRSYARPAIVGALLLSLGAIVAIEVWDRRKAAH